MSIYSLHAADKMFTLHKVYPFYRLKKLTEIFEVNYLRVPRIARFRKSFKEANGGYHLILKVYKGVAVFNRTSRV